MKKIISIFLTAAVCLLCLTGAAAAEYIKYSECAFADTTAIDDTVYIRTTINGIYTWKPGEKELTLYESGYEWTDYEGLVAIDGVLYTVNKENYQFTGIGENGRGAPLDGVAVPGFKKTAHLGEGWQIVCMRNTPHGLFWMTYPTSYSDKLLLCRLDLTTMKLSCRSVPHIYSYCIGDDGTTWIVQPNGETFLLFTLDWDSGKLTKEADLPRGAGGMIMKDGNMIFNAREQVVRRTPDGDIETLGQVPILQSNHHNGFLLNDDLLVYFMRNEMTSFSLSEAQEQ